MRDKSGESAVQFAAEMGAEIASANYGEAAEYGGGYSLSPRSLLNIPAGLKLVLPSPNGSALSLGTGTTPTLAGCLRNCRVVARAAQQIGQRIAVIPAGERWPDGSLRPALEDWLGAGAIINELNRDYSPEAEAARIAFREAQASLTALIQGCSSGKELIECGREADVILATQLNVSECAPLLLEGAYQKMEAEQQ
jgi:2-phosphosulfolactate phosphatase